MADTRSSLASRRKSVSDATTAWAEKRRSQLEAAAARRVSVELGEVTAHHTFKPQVRKTPSKNLPQEQATQKPDLVKVASVAANSPDFRRQALEIAASIIDPTAGGGSMENQLSAIESSRREQVAAALATTQRVTEVPSSLPNEDVANDSPVSFQGRVINDEPDAGMRLALPVNLDEEFQRCKPEFQLQDASSTLGQTPMVEQRSCVQEGLRLKQQLNLQPQVGDDLQLPESVPDVKNLPQKRDSSLNEVDSSFLGMIGRRMSQQLLILNQPALERTTDQMQELQLEQSDCDDRLAALDSVSPPSLHRQHDTSKEEHASDSDGSSEYNIFGDAHRQDHVDKKDFMAMENDALSTLGQPPIVEQQNCVQEGRPQDLHDLKQRLKQQLNLQPQEGDDLQLPESVPDMKNLPQKRESSLIEVDSSFLGMIGRRMSQQLSILIQPALERTTDQMQELQLTQSDCDDRLVVLDSASPPLLHQQHDRSKEEHASDTDGSSEYNIFGDAHGQDNADEKDLIAMESVRKLLKNFGHKLDAEANRQQIYFSKLEHVNARCKELHSKLQAHHTSKNSEVSETLKVMKTQMEVSQGTSYALPQKDLQRFGILQARLEKFRKRSNC